MTRKLTMEQVRKYIAQDAGCCCPFCDASSIEGKELESEADRTYQEILCRECGATWVDGYTLDSVGTGNGEEFEFLYSVDADESTAGPATREPLPNEAESGSKSGAATDTAKRRKMSLRRATKMLRSNWSSKSGIWAEVALTDLLLDLVVWCDEYAVNLDAALASARDQARALHEITAETHVHAGSDTKRCGAPGAAEDTDTSVPPSLPGLPRGCQKPTCGCDSKGQSGLVIKPPPDEADDEPLLRVVYAIDLGAANPLAAAEEVHRIMTDPDSLPPVLDVIDHSAKVTRIDLSDTADARQKGDRS